MAHDAAAQRHRYSSYTMVLPVYNEESRVGRVIEYYRPFARLLVIDNFSIDRTVEIARSLGVETVQHKNAGTIQTPEWFRHVTTLVETDHFALLSCSEFIPPPLLRLFDEVASAGSADVVSCVRDSYTCGELIPLWGGRSDRDEARIERFFDKRGLDLDGIVIHGNFSPLREDRLRRLAREEGYVVTHLRDFDATSLMRKITEYAAVEARDRARQGRPMKFVSLLSAWLTEIANFLRLPFAIWNRIALREVWARMVMHSVIYWVGWELEEGRTIDFSREKSEQLWKKLVGAQKE